MAVNHVHVLDPAGIRESSANGMLFFGMCAVCSARIQSINGLQWEVATEPMVAAPKYPEASLVPAAAANARQVGGTHYRANTVPCVHCGQPLQHWDIYQFFPYLIGYATKYLWRWRDKGGVQDLEKACHTVQKQIETAKWQAQTKAKAGAKL